MNADVAFPPQVPKGIAPAPVTVVPPRPIRPATTESPVARVILIGLALIFMGVMLVLPLVSVFAEALAEGIGHYLTAIADPDALSAIRLTLLVAAIAVPLNLV